MKRDHGNDDGSSLFGNNHAGPFYTLHFYLPTDPLSLPLRRVSRGHCQIGEGREREGGELLKQKEEEEEESRGDADADAKKATGEVELFSLVNPLLSLSNTVHHQWCFHHSVYRAPLLRFLSSIFWRSISLLDSGCKTLIMMAVMDPPGCIYQIRVDLHI